MEMLAYKTDKSKYFAPPLAEFERFQKWPADATFELVETSYFGFNIPEHQINAEIYHWYHPVLGVSSGGVIIYRGKKPTLPAADFCDYRSFMPMPKDIIGCVQSSGVRIDMLEPNKRFRIQYEDAPRATRFDFEADAIMPLPVRWNGGHLTQAMRVRGTLTLRGREYAIDSYFLRDRSWGDPRTEKPLPIPALHWGGAVFNDHFAFHVASFDSPKHHPEWANTYPNIKDQQNHLWGWVWANDRLVGITSVDQRMFHAADGLFPDRVELRIEDHDGGIYDINGTVVAGIPFNAWDNMTTYWCLGRWECNGYVGYGDLQNCVWNDYAQAALRSPP
jgi:hypothetical protein